MLGTLFRKECKQILKSMVYYIYVVVFVIFLSSQLRGDLTDHMERPLPDQENYGTVNSHEPEAVMGKTLAELVMETNRNSYATYPMGFYRGVTLNEQEMSEMISIIQNCTGKTWEALLEEMEEHFLQYDQSTIEGAMQAQSSYTVPVKSALSYQEFCENMEKVCEIIGSGSSYQKGSLEAGIGVPMTYEQAVEEFETLCEKDRVTGAVSRLFSDYAGIVLSVLPIFLGVTRCLRDKRAQVSQVVFAHEASAWEIIGSRYLANVFMAFLPVLLTAFVMQVPYQYHARTIGVTPDALAFLKYNLIWLLPEIMIVLAVSFFITELTENVISIFIQVFWAMASLMSSYTLVGGFSLKLILRWNTFGATREFWLQRQQLFLNRMFYFGLAVALILLTMAVYEKKRREGETLYGKIFKGRQ
ncbi:MAG: hypothetical protein HFH41_00850 [Lachnospiraceae bacterium]|nr:hypothetical protein [Lachnospiraceae bacterium]